MDQQKPNFLRIDSIRHSEGWKEYSKYMEDKYFQSLQKLVNEGGEVNRGHSLALKEMLAFVRKPPQEIKEPKVL